MPRKIDGKTLTGCVNEKNELNQAGLTGVMEASCMSVTSQDSRWKPLLSVLFKSFGSTLQLVALDKSFGRTQC